MIDCEKECKKMFYCFECQETSLKKCKEHDIGVLFYTRDIDVNHYYNKAAEKLGLSKSKDFPVYVTILTFTSSPPKDNQLHNTQQERSHT